MEGIQELCVVDIVMGTKLQCATLSISIGNSCNEKLIYREGELRMCKKVGGEVVSESTTPSTEVQEKSAAETIDEEIQKIVQKPRREGIPEVSLSEEKTRKNVIEF